MVSESGHSNVEKWATVFITHGGVYTSSSFVIWNYGPTGEIEPSDGFAVLKL